MPEPAPAPMAEERRKEIFQELVEAQDREMSVAESRRLLTDRFQELGYRVLPSAANFLLVEAGDGAAFRRALLPHGLVVRDCASFGLPGCVRVACRLPEECARLMEAVERLGARARV